MFRESFDKKNKNIFRTSQKKREEESSNASFKEKKL